MGARGNSDIALVTKSSLQYAQKCLSLCSLSSDNFCTGTQKCLMNGLLTSTNVSSCKSQACISAVYCANLNVSTVTQCSQDSGTLIQIFNGVWNSSLSDTIKQKTLAFAHGLQGCWKSAHSDWSLKELITNIATYAPSVNVTDATTGFDAMLKKFTQQKLTFEWAAAYMAAKCDPSSGGLTSSPKSIVCRGHPTTSRLDSGKTDYLTGSSMRYPSTRDADKQTHCFFTNSVSSVPPDCTCTAGGFKDLSVCFDTMLDDHHGCPPGATCCIAEDATTHSGEESLLGSNLLEDLLVHDDASTETGASNSDSGDALTLAEMLQTGFGG